MKYSLLFAVFIAFYCKTEAIDYSGTGQSVEDVTKGVFNKIPHNFLSFKEFFEASKNFIAGWPFTKVTIF